MLRESAHARGRAIALAAVAPLLLFTAACGSIGFDDQPAHGYEWGSGEPLRIAVVNEAPAQWSPALETAMQVYRDGTGGRVQFQSQIQGAHIVITVKEYSDSSPPQLRGYDFPRGAGGFATVYDAQGIACNYPPSTLPLTCSGEITTAQVWLNSAIPSGSDIEARRIRLIIHELGHSMGLTRHAPTIDASALGQRYGWP